MTATIVGNVANQTQPTAPAAITTATASTVFPRHAPAPEVVIRSWASRTGLYEGQARPPLALHPVTIAALTNQVLPSEDGPPVSWRHVLVSIDQLLAVAEPFDRSQPARRSERRRTARQALLAAVVILAASTTALIIVIVQLVHAVSAYLAG